MKLIDKNNDYPDKFGFRITQLVIHDALATNAICNFDVSGNPPLLRKLILYCLFKMLIEEFKNSGSRELQKQLLED